MTVQVPGGTLRLNLQRVTALSWAVPDPPFGDLACEIFIGGIRRRFFDRMTLYREAYHMPSTSPRAYVMRLTIDADFDAKWKTVAELNTADAFNDLLVSAGIYESAASTPGVDDICPAASLTRTSDKVLDVTFTPQVASNEDAIDTVTVRPPYVAPTVTTSHMVKMDGSALLTAELPTYGAVPAMAPDRVVTATGAASVLRADVNGEYRITVDGVADVLVASGYNNLDVVGINLAVQFVLDQDRFKQFNAQFTSTFIGDRVTATVDDGQTMADHTHSGGGQLGVVDGLVASAVALGYDDAAGSILLNAAVIDSGTTAIVRFDPGYSPGPSDFTWATTGVFAPTLSTPERPNPYSAPYDTDIRYGFYWSDPPTARVYGPDGTLIATNTDLESAIPAHATPRDFTEIESGTGVYMGYVSSTELQGSISILVFDDTLVAGDEVFVELDLPHVLL